MDDLPDTIFCFLDFFLFKKANAQEQLKVGIIGIKGQGRAQFPFGIFISPLLEQNGGSIVIHLHMRGLFGDV
jgi:hypothetical protein